MTIPEESQERNKNSQTSTEPVAISKKRKSMDIAELHRFYALAAAVEAISVANAKKRMRPKPTRAKKT